MKIATVGVAAKDLEKSVEFYALLGFKFELLKKGMEHIEAVSNGIRFMIDSNKMIEKVLGVSPIISNNAHISLEFETKSEIDELVSSLRKNNHKIKLEPFEASWGQYYATLEDPDGNLIDVYAWSK